MSKQNRTEWMIVYVTPHLTDAQIVVGRLQHEGIPAFVDHMAGRGAFGITIGTWGEVRVLVHPKDYEMALDILEPDIDALPEGDDDDDDIIYYDDWKKEDDE